MTDQKLFTKAVITNTEVIIKGRSSAGNEYTNRTIPVKLSSVGGLAGVDLTLSYSAGITYKGVLLGEEVKNFDMRESVGDGYVCISISNENAVAKDISSRILYLKFEVNKTLGDTKEEWEVEIHEIKLKDVYGEDFLR